MDGAAPAAKGGRGRGRGRGRGGAAAAAGGKAAARGKGGAAAADAGAAKPSKYKLIAAPMAHVRVSTAAQGAATIHVEALYA